MRRFTTPTHTLTVEGVDLTNATGVWVTYENAYGGFTITDADVSLDGEDTVIVVELTEKQTASLSTGKARVQVNWTQNGKRCATEVKTVSVLENLLDEELL